MRAARSWRTGLVTVAACTVGLSATVRSGLHRRDLAWAVSSQVSGSFRHIGSVSGPA
jgi:hypothetical protein